MMARQQRVLVVSPSFFGYEEDIVKEIERVVNCDVDFVDERPSNTALARAIIRASPRLLARAIRGHFASAAEEVSQRGYSLVLVIKAEVTPRWFLQMLREKNPNAVFVFYTFDSLKINSRCVQLFDEFDYLFSFDRQDCETWDQLVYKPLFYVEAFSKPALPLVVRDLDVSFVGTLHSNRYHDVHDLAAKVPPQRTHLFFYAQARWYFWAQKLRGPYRHIPWREASYRKMDRSQVAELFRTSEAVIDVQREGQSGLTMRTFEVLAAGAGLITTNQSVKDEEFYDPRYILVTSPSQSGSGDEVAAFISRLPSDQMLQPSMQPFSIENWVQHLVALADVKPNIHEW